MQQYFGHPRGKHQTPSSHKKSHHICISLFFNLNSFLERVITVKWIDKFHPVVNRTHRSDIFHGFHFFLLRFDITHRHLGRERRVKSHTRLATLSKQFSSDVVAAGDGTKVSQELLDDRSGKAIWFIFITLVILFFLRYTDSCSLNFSFIKWLISSERNSTRDDRLIMVVCPYWILTIWEALDIDIVFLWWYWSDEEKQE